MAKATNERQRLQERAAEDGSAQRLEGHAAEDGSDQRLQEHAAEDGADQRLQEHAAEDGSDQEQQRLFTEAQISEMLDLLRQAYPQAGCALHHYDNFELLVAVVLSAQTTDVSVNKVTPQLYGKYPDARALAEADQEDVIELIRTIGMYKTKSRNIIRLAQALCEKHGGEVPEDYDALVALPGVGRKTANVVLAEGFGHQRIAVDTHVFRLANRIGLARAKDVLKTEYALMDILPEDRWTEAHHCLIFHGRNCCTARKPDCRACPIAHLCRKVGVEDGSESARK